MRYNEITAKLNEAAKFKFNVFVEISYAVGQRRTGFEISRMFEGSTANEVEIKAEAELDAYFEQNPKATSVPGWKSEGKVEYPLYDPDEPNKQYVIADIFVVEEPKVTKPAKKSKASATARTISSEEVAEVLFGNERNAWYQADLDYLAYENDKESALDRANQFNLELDGIPYKFVDCKRFDNDGDMGWIWHVAPK